MRVDRSIDFRRPISAVFVSEQRLQPSSVPREGAHDLDERHLLNQRRSMDCAPWARGVIAGSIDGGGVSVICRAGNASVQHQLSTVAAAADPVAGAAAPATAAATADPVTAVRFRLYPFEDSPALRHAGRPRLSHAEAPLVVSEQR